ncbi:MAG TPA: UDP-N-acetylmuramate dehydrogenase [Polyangia bacterium]|nr:UDP-N-acetylmuramate dehydrogenase [Polyangia bacterium]
MDEAERRAIEEALGGEGELRFDEPMARHTTLRIGGPVDAWVAPSTLEALRRVRAACSSRGVVSRAFGSGSNLLVRDGGVRGVAISLKSLAEIRGDAGVVHVEAGASTGKLLRFATERGLGGVEFLGGVPGTVGGGMIMNAGTYLGEFKDVTTQVVSVDEAGRSVTRSNAECGFAYRHSTLPPSEIVVAAELSLQPRPREEIEQAVRELRDRRRAREPHGVPNAGSIFKNPPNDYAGRLIEACGLKGRRVGGAEVSPAHANWIVNAGGARARDVLDLVDIVRAEVVKRFGITLELEVKVVGDE